MKEIVIEKNCSASCFQTIFQTFWGFGQFYRPYEVVQFELHLGFYFYFYFYNRFIFAFSQKLVSKFSLKSPSKYTKITKKLTFPLVWSLDDLRGKKILQIF